MPRNKEKVTISIDDGENCEWLGEVRESRKLQNLNLLLSQLRSAEYYLKTASVYARKLSVAAPPQVAKWSILLDYLEGTLIPRVEAEAEGVQEDLRAQDE